jgi:hypothetical protein
MREKSATAQVTKQVEVIIQLHKRKKYRCLNEKNVLLLFATKCLVNWEQPTTLKTKQNQAGCKRKEGTSVGHYNSLLNKKTDISPRQNI